MEEVRLTVAIEERSFHRPGTGEKKGSALGRGVGGRRVGGKTSRAASSISSSPK